MLNKTDEQIHILDLATRTSDNLMLNAFAGCGKTSTLEMIERVAKQKPILYLVFNKRNAEEAKERMLSTTTVRTFNSLGHRVWAQSRCKNLTLDFDKTKNILKELINAETKAKREPLWERYFEIIQAVGMAKAIGYIPEGVYPDAKRLVTATVFHQSLDEEPDDITSDLIDAVLVTSIKQSYAGTIDFNDQIYMPALFGGTFPRFPLVKVDESQDLSPVNHALLERLVKGRVIAVGDPFQNIYGFCGATAKGMESLKSLYSMTPCDLSISFRCPQAIVEAARWRVPQFKWIKPGGHVEVLEKLSLSDIPDSATVLCRNNAPLFRLAIRLLSNKRSVSVAGSELGPKIVAIMRKLGDESMGQASLLSAIDDWFLEKEAKGSKTAADISDCMRVFASFGKTLEGATGYAETLFRASGSIRLMTGHKSKGLEFDHVIHLDPWILQAHEQDLNLRYVIQTRSKNRYFEINSPQIV